jgi:nitrate reductase gamma subunit
MFGSAIFFIGILFILPAYLKSIEQQISSDGRFRPFDIKRIFKYCGAIRKTLLVIGLIIWIAYLLLWVNQSSIPQESTNDIKKDVLIVCLVWASHVYGYCREV